MRFARISLPLLCAATFLTGCGFTADTIAPINPDSSGIHGIIMGGQQAVNGSSVEAWALGSGAEGAQYLGGGMTHADGSFSIASYTCPPGPFTTVVRGVPEGLGTAARGIKSAARPAVKAHVAPSPLPDLTDSYVFITASGGDPGGGANTSLLLAAGVGPCKTAANQSVEINEVSTVVFATAMAQYTHLDATNISTESSSMEAIAAMDVADTNTIQAFLNTISGMVNPNVVATTPGGISITIDAAKIYSLANTIASCVNSTDDTTTTPGTPLPSGACAALFSNLQDASSVDNTLDAAFDIARNPYHNVSTLWTLGTSRAPFTGGLSGTPNDWTFGISYTTSAMGLGLFADANGVPMSSNIDIDSSGRVWFPSNKSGATGVGYFDPTELAFNGPFGGSTLVRPQYVALDDNEQLAFVTDLGSPNVEYVDTTPSGINSAASFAIPNGTGDTGVTIWTGPLFINSDDSLDLAYNDIDGGTVDHDLILIEADQSSGGVVGEFTQPAAAVTLNTLLGDHPNHPTDPIAVGATNGKSTKCKLEVVGMADQGALAAGFGTTANPCTSGGAATGAVNQTGTAQDEVTTATTSNQYCSQVAGACSKFMVYNNTSGSQINLLNGPVGVAFDGNNQLWVANSGDDSISVIYGETTTTGNYDPVSDRPFLHGSADGGTMTSPAGIAIDSAGNVWVSNATCTSTGDTTCSFTLSEVIGVADPTITPLSSQADQLQGTEPGAPPVPLGTGHPVAAVSKKSAAHVIR